MYLNNIDVSNGFVIHTRPFRLNSSQILKLCETGWWYTLPSEKY